MTIPSYSTTAATNASADGINYAEGQAPSTLNNSARQVMADTRTQWNDAEWFEYRDGTPIATTLIVYVSSSSFKITGVDATAWWHVGRRVKISDVSPLVTYSTITATSYGAGATTVTIDSTALTNVTLTAYGSIISAVNSPLGVVNADTVTVSGDTAAGDLATMGYTATEGLILTGQGSTNDVTIKNDADATVMSIATGGTTAAFAGAITAPSGNISGTLTVASAGDINLRVGSSDANSYMSFYDDTTTSTTSTYMGAVGNTFKIFTASTQALVIDASQNVTFAGDVDIGNNVLHLSGSRTDTAGTATMWDAVLSTGTWGCRTKTSGSALTLDWDTTELFRFDVIGGMYMAGSLKVSGTAATISSGTGTPEAAVTAPIGSLFTRTDGGASTTLYVKESGTGTTGWVAK
tara:strand:- start:20381 stop:21604 length:1224 start_codon:yes stop_codon:yes gene_type:complete